MSEVTKEPTPTPTPQESVAEVLGRLERAYIEQATLTRNIKEQLIKIQDQLLAAQDAEHRSFQNFTNAKEQYLVSVITHQRNALESVADPDVPIIVEPVETRDDNVDTE